MNNKTKLRKGGYIADFAEVSTPTDYTLYIPPPRDTATSSSEGAVLVSNTPGMTNGVTKGGNYKKGGSGVNLPNEFYYSMKGGCAMCNSMKGGNYKRGGNVDLHSKQLKGGFALEPFITALALLGARMLADKEVGIFNNKSSKKSKYQEEEEED